MRLAIAEGGDDSCGNDLGSDDLSVADLAGIAATLHDQNLNRRALGSPGAVVEIKEISTGALVKDG